MSSASPTAAAASKPPPGGGAAGTFAINEAIAVGVLVALAVHGLLRFLGAPVEVPGLAALWELLPAWRPLPPTVADLPLLGMLLIGGAILVAGLLGQVMAGVFGADFLAGVAILTSLFLGEWLAGVLVVLMLSGGKALEARAVSRAGSVLEALARRMPMLAHRREGGGIVEVALAEVAVGDVVVVFPHEICPVDGEVVAGHGTMDESYLTGEPWQMQKAPGVAVLSGAINGQGALEIRAARVAGDSRYARIVDVLRESEEHRPRLRRLADSLGALYTPLALAVAGAAWWVSGEATRFLAVLVVATPCPLLIGIPVAIIGAVSLAARRGIVIRDPAILERLATCRTGIFDKTGTLTYGTPHLTEVVALGEIDRDEILRLAAALEAYSKHPLAAAVAAAAADLGGPLPVEEVSERPGQGLTGRVGPAGATREVAITSRTKLAAVAGADGLPAAGSPSTPPAAAASFVRLVIATSRVTPVALTRPVSP